MIDLNDWRSAGATFNFSGRSIFTRRGGQEGAPPLLLIHGFPTSSWDWNKVWHPLAERYSLYTLDMLGFGDSAKPRDCAYLIAQQADLIEAWLSSEGIQEYHVLAHDYGATVTQELLARDNSRREDDRQGRCRLRIQTVCLLNGGLFPETHRPALIQRLLLSPLGPLVSRLTSKAKLASNLQEIFGEKTPPSEQEIESFWELIRCNNGDRVMHRLIGYMTQRRKNRARWVGALQQANVPVKLVNGIADPISGAHMVARFRQLIDKPNITELSGIGHYPQLEAPDAMTEAYFTFRDGVPEQVTAEQRELVTAQP
ncbi:alpha/beta hydrolase [Microbulbifer flavimaris]|uniref:Alpha/beta hydrolase n=1 Tax=Microbulbifer flavimaris TaxID=1781068 RepID=A0ABX4I1T0_9GAMM|nr:MULTISPECIES: alpha/beta hydrolase [Microbulbifer]KUJ83705.1 alpha/beta hydrolase [Microbulbifer sp. ZGT114]PCO05875.1 alpha/beta hydrolase [Microbulbifer flavimaris]